MFNPILYLVRSMVPHTCQPFTLSRPTTVGRTLGFKHYCGKNDKRGKHVLKIFTNHRDHKVQLVLLYNMFPSYFANVGRKKGRESGTIERRRKWDERKAKESGAKERRRKWDERKAKKMSRKKGKGKWGKRKAKKGKENESKERQRKWGKRKAKKMGGKKRGGYRIAPSPAYER